MTDAKTLFSRWLRDVPGTTWLSLIMIAVWLLQAAQTRSVFDTASAPLARDWMLYPPLIGTDFGWLRVISMMFVHLDASHLAINVAMLALIGREVERFVGTPMFLAFFFVGGLGASTLVAYLAQNTYTGGASGALYALMAVLVAISARRGTDLRAPIALVAVNVIYSFIAAGTVSLAGHLGGLLTGVVLSLAVLLPRPAYRRLLVTATLLILLVALGWYRSTLM